MQALQRSKLRQLELEYCQVSDEYSELLRLQATAGWPPTLCLRISFEYARLAQVDADHQLSHA